MANTTANQSNYKSNFNYDIDIDKVYSDFIKVIDETRSLVNITDPNNQSLFTKFTKDTFTGAPSTKGLKVENTPQESRCHAFYRIIGFPVVSDGSGYYNPGMDTIVESGRQITLDKKVDIANKLYAGFIDLSNERERYINDNLKIFSNNFTVDAGVLALSSINLRKFSSPFNKNNDAIETPFDFNNQKYDITKNSLVGNQIVPLTDYLGTDGYPATNFSTSRNHIIKPFMVDPRIDLSTPDLKKIAIPFVYDNNQLKIGDFGTAKRPLIEKVILDRFNVSNQTNNIGTLSKSVIDDISKIEAIKDEQLLKDVVAGKIYNLSEQQQFVKYLNIIRAMMNILVKSLIDIKKAQSKYYWLPTPSPTGPEGGFEVSFISLKQFSGNLKTTNDEAIITSFIKSLINDTNAQSAQANNIPDPGNYVLAPYTVTYDSDTSNALGDINSNNLNKLLTDRESMLKTASTALQKIEIIMGEFSGFGLCDIVAVMASLYLMPSNSLLGFLDPDSYQRASKVIKLTFPQNPADVKVALDDFTKTIKNIYDIMDNIYKETYTLNNKNK